MKLNLNISLFLSKVPTSVKIWNLEILILKNYMAMLGKYNRNSSFLLNPLWQQKTTFIYRIFIEIKM